jgi:hypothetical protein
MLAEHGVGGSSPHQITNVLHLCVPVPPPLLVQPVPGSSMATDEQIRTRLRELLAESDLETTTGQALEQQASRVRWPGFYKVYMCLQRRCCGKSWRRSWASN